MALPATLVWEIRPTNGTANAGGAFDPSVASPGTDFSQQNAVQIAFTDLVIGVTTTNLTSVANPFGSTHVGNTICITGGTGFTTGYYNIRSVAGVTATMDRSVGTTASVGGTGNLGGAVNGLSTGTNTVAASNVAGNTIYIKNEAWNEAVTFSVAGAPGTPITYEGYNTSRGDTPSGSNRPRNNRAAAAGNAFSGNIANLIYKNIWISNVGGTGAWANTALTCTFLNCRASNNTGYGFSIAGLMINCEADNNTTKGWNNSSTTENMVMGCYAHDNTTIGFDCSATVTQTFMFCISESNASHGVATSPGRCDIINCTFDGNTGATTDGHNSTTTAAGSVMYNCILSNNGRYGANATNSASWISDYNNFFGNGTAARNNWPTGAHAQTLDPTYTNASGGDFSIGKNLKALGWPGLFPSGTSTGYLDIGAVQRQEPTFRSTGYAVG